MADGDSRYSDVMQMQVRSDDKCEGGTWDSEDCGGVSGGAGCAATVVTDPTTVVALSKIAET